jgi:hypothetical protein
MPPCPWPHDVTNPESMLTGHEVPGVYDGVLFWRCAHCKACWPRFGAYTNPRLHDAAVRYLAEHPDGVFPGGLLGDLQVTEHRRPPL